MSIFHIRLKELKNQSSQPQSKIASDLGLTPQAFSYYINGREPNFDILTRIAKYFNVTTDYLLGLSSSKSGANDDILNQIGIEDDTIKVLKVDLDKRLYNRFIQHPYYGFLSSYISICFYFSKHEPLNDDYNSLKEHELNLLKRMFHIYDVLFATPSLAPDAEFNFEDGTRSFSDEDFNSFIRVFQKHFFTCDSPYFVPTIDKYTNSIITDLKKHWV